MVLLNLDKTVTGKQLAKALAESLKELGYSTKVEKKLCSLNSNSKSYEYFITAKDGKIIKDVIVETGIFGGIKEDEKYKRFLLKSGINYSLTDEGYEELLGLISKKLK